MGGISEIFEYFNNVSSLGKTIEIKDTYSIKENACFDKTSITNQYIRIYKS